MRYAKFYEDTDGITVGCKNGLVHVLSHRRRSLPPKSAYARVESAVGSGLVWIHFPMDVEETISTMWVCEIRGDSHVRSPTVLVSTDVLPRISIPLSPTLVTNLVREICTLWSLCMGK